MTQPITHETVQNALSQINDADLSDYKFYAPFNIGASIAKDENILLTRLQSVESTNTSQYYRVIQQYLWEKFQENPWINTSVVDFVGRLTGRGFETSSSNTEVKDFVNWISNDIRNQLYDNMPKCVGRHRIEGELYQVLTLHDNGFVEVDFVDPGTISGGDGNSGKYFHPTKPNFVLAYGVQGVASDGVTMIDRIIPSINIAHFPELMTTLKGKINFSIDKMTDSMTSNRKYKKIGGCKQFIIEWNTGLFTKRNVSSLRTTLEWINHYETLKKYEIDHKKAAGAYLWVITIEDPKAFRTWLSMTDAERAKTGVMGDYLPGGKIILPPGMDMKAMNPTLPNISGTDTDILHMVTAGLNAPEDMVTGQSGGTYASVKASRAPQGDRVSDSIEQFERFLRFTFWRSIFHLASVMKAIPAQYKVEEAVEFKNQEPVFKKVVKQPHELLEFTFPVSEVSDLESLARSMLGVKHGSFVDVLGLPAGDIARKMGFGNYASARLRKATEDKQFPELLPAVDQESAQETGVAGETPKSGVKKKPKVVKKTGGTEEQKPTEKKE